jgi:hypothetical protein
MSTVEATVKPKDTVKLEHESVVESVVESVTEPVVDSVPEPVVTITRKPVSDIDHSNEIKNKTELKNDLLPNVTTIEYTHVLQPRVTVINPIKKSFMNTIFKPFK